MITGTGRHGSEVLVFPLSYGKTHYLWKCRRCQVIKAYAEIDSLPDLIKFFKWNQWGRLVDRHWAEHLDRKVPHEATSAALTPTT